MDVILKVIRQTGWQLTGKAITVITTFVIIAAITRNLGKYNTGIYTLAATYINFFFLAVDLGFNGYLLPQLPENPLIPSYLISIRFFLSLVLMIIADVLVLFLPFSTPLFIHSVWIGSVAIFFYGLANTYNFIFQWKLRFDKYVLANSLGAIFSVPLFLFLTLHHFPVSWLFLAFLLNWIINSFLLSILVKSYYNFVFIKNIYYFSKRLIFSAWPISLTLVLNTVYFRADAFILSAFRPFTDVGLYNVAYQIFQNILTIPTFIMNSYYPLMIKSRLEGRTNFKNHLFLASFFLLILSLIGSVLTFLFAPFVITLLSGPSYSKSISSLQILSFSFPAYFLTSLFMWVFVLEKKYRILFVIYSIGLVTNVVLNLIFIPRFSFYAASWITGVSEYLILTLQLIILLKSI